MSLPHAHGVAVIVMGEGANAEIVFELHDAQGKPIAHAHFGLQGAADFALNLVDIVLQEGGQNASFGEACPEPVIKPH